MAAPLPFKEFLDALRLHRIPLGIGDYLAAGQLLARWQGANREQLRDAFAAVLAKNQEEVRTIQRLFDQYYPLALDESPPKPPLPIPQRGRTRPFVLVLAAVIGMMIAGLGSAKWRAWKVSRKIQDGVGQSSRGTGIVGSSKAQKGKEPSAAKPAKEWPSSMSASSPMSIRRELLDEEPDPQEPLPPLVAQRVPPLLPVIQVVAPIRRLGALFGVVYLLSFAYLYGRSLRRRRHRAARQIAQMQLAQDSGPRRYPLKFGPLAPAVARDDIEEFATLLNRLCVSYQIGQALDAAETAERCARRGYLDKPVFRPQLLRQGIVVLQDTGLLSRLFARQFGALLDGLTRRGIPLIRYGFDEDPSAVCSGLHAPDEPLAVMLKRHPEAPVLLLCAGARLTSDAGQLLPWVMQLQNRRPVAWLHPIPDQQSWHPRLRRTDFPIRVFSLNRNGLQAAAHALSSDRGLRPQLQHQAQEQSRSVPVDGLRRLLRLIALVPHADLNLIEWLRQHMCPDVPAHACVYLFEVSEDTTGRTVRLPEALLLRMIKELRREEPDREVEVRRALLRLYRRSEPPKTNWVAHLRWQLDCAMQELMLVTLGGAPEIPADAPHPIETIQELRRGPFWESVEEELVRITGQRRADIKRPAYWPLPDKLPQQERRRIERYLKPSGGTLFLASEHGTETRRSLARPRLPDVLLPFAAALVLVVAAYTGRILHAPPPRHKLAYEIAWTGDLNAATLGDGRLHIQALPGAGPPETLELLDLTNSKHVQVVGSLSLNHESTVDLPLLARPEPSRFMVRAVRTDGSWTHSHGISLPPHADFFGELSVRFIDKLKGVPLNDIGFKVRHGTQEQNAHSSQWLRLRAGTLELDGTAPGFLPFKRRLRLVPGTRNELTIRLRPQPPADAPAQVELKLNAAGVMPAEVLVDGKPWDGQPFFHPPGNLQIRINNDFFDYQQTFTLGPGELVTIPIEAVPVSGVMDLTVQPETAEVSLPPGLKVIRKTVVKKRAGPELLMKLRGAPGHYTVSIDDAGFEASKVAIVIPGGQTTSSRIALTRSKPYFPLGDPNDPDRDGDGIPNKQDKCPDQPEDFDRFEDEDGCPDDDNDKDGILDKQDKCPNQPGPKENNGCPDTDKDGDGVVDRLDLCIDEPGLPDLKGCPNVDRDGDGIIDGLDRCPDEAGKPAFLGCTAPPPIRKYMSVTEKNIELLQRISFLDDKATISSSSMDLLNEVISTLRSRPNMRIRIECHVHMSAGHGLQWLMRLSNARADAVRQYLISRGIESSRLTAQGYGTTSPICRENTDSCREKNNRVDFIILQQ